MKAKLFGKMVLLWAPDDAICDSTGQVLDGKLTLKGMVEEIESMSSCWVGEPISLARVEKIKQEHPNTRVISTRWVTAFKSVERVRSRIVAKDFAKGSARMLGMSSPTPGAESLGIMLTMAASMGARVCTLDIAHAFMHSELPEGQRVILKMPTSVSGEDGQPVYLDLYKSLNGLRDACLVVEGQEGVEPAWLVQRCA